MYKLTNNNMVIRLSDGARIPMDTNNMDYQAVLQWISEGGVIQEADPEPTPVKYIPIETVLARIESLGKTDDAWKALKTAQQIRFLTLKDGIAVDDAEVTALLKSLNIDVSQILY